MTTFFVVVAGIVLGLVVGVFTNIVSVRPRTFVVLGAVIAALTVAVAFSSPVIGVPLAVLTVFFYAEAIGWLVQLSQSPSRATIDHQYDASDSRATTAVLIFHGLMGNERQLESQYSKLAEWGDIYAVNTYGRVYDPELVAKTAAKAIRNMLAGKGPYRKYDNVVLIGISLGGRIAFESLKRLDAIDHEYDRDKIRVVLMGTPLDWHSVYGPKVVKLGSAIVGRLAPGYILGAVGSKAMQAMFRPPKPENTELNASRARIRAGVEAAKRTPFKVWISQMFAFVGRPAPEAGAWALLACQVVYVWYNKDHDTVDQEAAVGDIADALDAHALKEGAFQVVHADSAHCGFEEAPDATAKSLDRVYVIIFS